MPDTLKYSKLQGSRILIIGGKQSNRQDGMQTRNIITSPKNGILNANSSSCILSEMVWRSLTSGPRVPGTSGIGYAVAEAALESGASAIIVASSDPSKVAATISPIRQAYPELSSRASIIGQACDLSDASALEANVQSLLEFASENGTKPLDHIINTAGSIEGMLPLAETNPENLLQLLTIRFSVPAMIAKHAVAGKHLSRAEF